MIASMVMHYNYCAHSPQFSQRKNRRVFFTITMENDAVFALTGISYNGPTDATISIDPPVAAGEISVHSLSLRAPTEIAVWKPGQVIRVQLVLNSDCNIGRKRPRAHICFQGLKKWTITPDPMFPRGERPTEPPVTDR
jgi:hypothetical protein